MAKVLTKETEKKVKDATYKKADKFGYLTSGRVESGKFIDSLVTDPEVGGILKEYLAKERIRTYIKDGILNSYRKSKNEELLDTTGIEAVVERIYGQKTSVIQTWPKKNSRVYVLRDGDGRIYIISNGTVLKWETALRKALDIIAREPGLIIKNTPPAICLRLADGGTTMTESERNHITKALAVFNVKAIFCGE